MTWVKKGFTAVFAVGVLALVLVSTPIVGAQEVEYMQGTITMTFDASNVPACTLDDSCFWTGTIGGDLIGTVEVHEFWDQNYVIGNTGHLLGTEHFFERFTIQVGTEWISGVDQGVWNLGTLKFRANGWVTASSPDLDYLVGYKLHEMGVAEITATGYLATAEWFLVAP